MADKIYIAEVGETGLTLIYIRAKHLTVGKYLDQGDSGKWNAIPANPLNPATEDTVKTGTYVLVDARQVAPDGIILFDCVDALGVQYSGGGIIEIKDDTPITLGSRATPADILQDPATDKIDGSNINATIGSRATPADILVTPANKLEGSNLDATISSRATPADILITPANKLEGANLDAPVSECALEDGGRLEAIDTLTGTNLDATVGSRATPADILVNVVNKLDGLNLDAKVSETAVEDGGRLEAIDTLTALDLDGKISSRAAPGDILVDPVTDKINGSLLDASVAATAKPSDILADVAHKVDGELISTNLDATVGSRATPADILVDIAHKVDGELISTNLDATVGSRATPGDVTSAVTSIKGISDKDNTQIFTAITNITVGPQIYVDVESDLARPVSGNKPYRMFLGILDGKGVPLAPDSTPTIKIESVLGIPRVVETDMTYGGSVGQYYYDYIVTSISVLETEKVQMKIIIATVTQYRNSFTEIYEEGGGGYEGTQL